MKSKDLRNLSDRQLRRRLARLLGELCAFLDYADLMFVTDYILAVTA